MGLDENLSKALDIEHKVESKEIIQGEVGNEIVTYEEPIDTSRDQEDDYRLARRVLRNLINKGNDAIDEISQIARQNESARGYEVQSTLIKTVSDVVKDLYDIQKMTKDLREPDKKEKLDETNITVDKAVFVGTTAELLTTMKEKEQKENG